jgi:tetratricopeptide (TPR) repeat protein
MAIDIDPKFVLAYLKRGEVKFQLQDYNGTMADFSKAIEINPKSAVAYYNRGIIKIMLEQKDSGCLDLSKAGELGYEQAYEAIKKYCN